MIKSTTQQFLMVEQIREGVMVLKDKSLRGVLMVSSLNFALKSDQEQTAILYQFQDFLNSLDFPCQILIQSRRLNLTTYLERLKELEKKEENRLLKLQIADYHDFIEHLVATGLILTKSFYVIVPFTLAEARGLPPTKIIRAKLTEEEFQRCKTQLWQRMEFIALGLKRCGLQSIPLSTLELIELLWSLHHPKEAEIGYLPEIPPELSH
jgi:hypothetical protein